jgi:hypothetical protein
MMNSEGRGRNHSLYMVISQHWLARNEENQGNSQDNPSTDSYSKSEQPFKITNYAFPSTSHSEKYKIVGEVEQNVSGGEWK